MAASVKFGMVLNSEDPPAGAHIDRVVDEACIEAQVAGEAAFDGCFAVENHQMPNGMIPSPLVLATAVAARTRRIRIGTDIVILPLYHPIRVAEDGAAIDVLSKGRFILGVASGFLKSDFEAYGIPFSRRISLFEEGVEVIRRAWTEDQFSFVGKRFDLKKLSITPKPMQKPHPPIWVGAVSVEGVKRAARIGDAWAATPMHSLAGIRRLVPVYREHAERRGKRPSIALMMWAYTAESRAKARAEYEKGLMRTVRDYWTAGAFHIEGHEEFDPWASLAKSEEDVRFEHVQDRVILGSPEECIEQIHEWREATGADYLVLRFRHAEGPSHEQAVRALRLFGEKVIPRLQ
jgi:probable F420-dependent oxidoreductase